MQQDQTMSLIVSADDIGLAPEFTSGALRAFREGVVTAGSVISASPLWAETLAQLREQPGLDLGVHLCLFDGVPVLPAARVPRLVDGHGAFHSDLARVVAAVMASRGTAEQVLAEWRAQIQQVVEGGIQPTHLDGHKHLHLLPPLLDGVLSLCAEFGIAGLRLPAEEDRGPRVLVRTGLRTLSRRARAQVQSAGLRVPDRVRGLAEAGRGCADLYRRWTDELRPGLTEWICHPGTGRPAQAFPNGQLPRWAQDYDFATELEALTSSELSRSLQDRGVRLCGYGPASAAPG